MQTETPKPGAPRAGYKRASQRIELAGYWLAESGPVHGLLVGAFESKQKSGKGKGKIRLTYVLKLIDPCVARVKLEGGAYDVAELAAGEFIGIFGGPGLRDLQGLYGCKVAIARKPEMKPTANGDMWDYDIDFAGQRRPLPVRKYVESQATEPEPGDAVETDDGDASFNPDDYAF